MVLSNSSNGRTLSRLSPAEFVHSFKVDANPAHALLFSRALQISDSEIRTWLCTTERWVNVSFGISNFFSSDFIRSRTNSNDSTIAERVSNSLVVFNELGIISASELSSILEFASLAADASDKRAAHVRWGVRAIEALLEIRPDIATTCSHISTLTPKTSMPRQL